VALREDVLPVFLGARQLIQDLGLRTHRVIVRTYSYAGGQANRGARSVLSDVELLPRPKVRETDDGYEITKITPQTIGGGYTPADLNPAHVNGRIVVFVIVDPAGVERECLFAPGHTALSTDRNFGYSLRVVHRERINPT
jgi:hypothetical protein